MTGPAAMTPHTIVQAMGSYGGAFVIGAISSVIPFISVDIFLIGLTLAAGASVATAIPIAVLAAGGQLAGKLPIFLASRAAGRAARHGADQLRSRRERPGRPGRPDWTDRHRERLARIARVRARVHTLLARWQAPHALLALSALFSVPPFSIMATAAGVLAIRLRWFCAIVFTGRAARFAILIAITSLAAR